MAGRPLTPGRVRLTRYAPSRGRIVAVLQTEVAAQQFQHGQPRRGLTVRDRIRFEDFAGRRDSRLELVEQPRLAGARLGHHRDHLPVPAYRQLERALQLLKLALAPDELRQTAPRRALKMR